MPLFARTLPGTRLRASLLARDSRVRDPATGEERRISEEKPIEGEIELSRELPAWGGKAGLFGGAIAGLSRQVAEMTEALDRAHGEAKTSAGSLEDSTRRAEAAARKLELMLAALHDLPAGREESAAPASEPKAATPAPAPAPTTTGPTFRRSFGANRREAAE